MRPARLRARGAAGGAVASGDAKSGVGASKATALAIRGQHVLAAWLAVPSSGHGAGGGV